jgi:hypothetical protein
LEVQVRLDHKELKVVQGLPELLVRQVRKAIRVLQVLLVLLAFRVFRDHQVSQVLLVPKEIKDLQESLAQRDPKDLLE